jgi:hypothetical protein
VRVDRRRRRGAVLGRGRVVRVLARRRRVVVVVVVVDVVVFDEDAHLEPRQDPPRGVAVRVRAHARSSAVAAERARGVSRAADERAQRSLASRVRESADVVHASVDDDQGRADARANALDDADAVADVLARVGPRRRRRHDDATRRDGRARAGGRAL